jgi:hypothetical protein
MKINTFSELMDEIAYSYLDGYKFKEYTRGHWGLNKLAITPTEVSYKMDLWELDPKVYQKFLQFIELLKD